MKKNLFTSMSCVKQGTTTHDAKSPSSRRGSVFLRNLLWTLCCIIIGFHGANAQVPIDKDGWAVLTPSSDSRIVYVSDSEGDDATGQVYSSSDSEVGSDPVQPSGRVNAFKTLNAAKTATRDSEPDWVLLKAGDTWENQRLPVQNGRSNAERYVVGYYGNGSRPEIKATVQNFIPLNFVKGLENVALTGVELYCAVRDPDSPYFPGADSLGGSQTGIRILDNGNNILLEDLKIRFFNYGVSLQDKQPWEDDERPNSERIQLNSGNLEVRRVIFTDAYHPKSSSEGKRKSSGIFIYGYDGISVVECTFDKNGWSDHPSLPNAGRSQYNHNNYTQFSNTGDIKLTGNILTRGSSHGTQQRSGAIINNNFLAENAIGIFVHGRGSKPAKNGKPKDEPGNAADETAVTNNVVLNGMRMDPSGSNDLAATGAVYGITVGRDSPYGNIVVKNNVVAHRIIASGETATQSKSIVSAESGVDNSDNIVYNWPITKTSLENMWDDSWLDPDRTLETYMASLGEAPTREAFYEKARARGLREWSQAYTAYAVNEYIRAGFNLGTTSSPAPTQQTTTKISTGIADGEENLSDGTVDLSSNDLDFRADNLSAMRFAVDVPQGATITSAAISFVAKRDYSGANQLTFSVQSVNNANEMTDATGSLSARKTTGSVVWNPGSWKDGKTYVSTDLSDLIQTIVNRSKWAPGKHMMIQVTSNASNDNRRSARTFDNSNNSDEAPQLLIAYATDEAARKTVQRGKPTETAELTDIPDELVLYPNPSTGQVSVLTAAQTQLTVHNLTGQQVAEITTEEAVGTLDLSHLKKGVYIVKATHRGHLQTRKLLLE